MRTALIAAVAAAALVAACSKEASPPAPAAAGASAPAAQSAQGAPNLDVIQAEAQGFTVGPAMSVRTVYVFFDAQCPHCSALWFAAKPLKSQAKFVWIPVRLLNDNSAAQGATILAAKDPAAAMDEHEASMVDHKGGIKASGESAAQKDAVKKNTELFNRFGFNSVPSLVTKNAQSGAMVTHEGAMPTADLAAFLGVPAPAQ